MAALSQILGGISAASSAVSGVVSLLNKWYPISTKENTESLTHSIRFVNNQVWSFSTGTPVKVSEDGGVTWVTKSPVAGLGTVVSGSPSLRDIAYGNGSYVIVGSLLGGTAIILHSTDGENWTRRTTTITNALTSIAWSPVLNLFLAVGGAGFTAYSSDGLTWTTGLRAGTADHVKVEWGGDKFGIVNGSGNAIYRSTNGTTFTAATVNAIPNNDITYSPSLGLWAVARTTGAGTPVMTSPDLVTWTSRSVANLATTFSAFGVHWNGTRFVLATNGGGTASSTDGLTWASSNSRVSQLGRMCTDTRTGAIIAASYIGAGTAVSYDNGFNWGSDLKSLSSPVGFLRSNATTVVNSICYTAGNYWVTNTSGNLYFSSDMEMWYSAPIPVAVTGALRAVCNASGATVPYLTAVGIQGAVGQIVTSLDGGLTWAVRGSGATGTGYNWCASNGVTTVAVSNDGKILTTTDGITWTARNSGTSASIRSVIYANGRFVAVGSLYAAYSTDGITWVNSSTSFGSFSGHRIIYDGTQFVVSGSQSATVNLKLSTDGSAWTTGPVAPWGTGVVSSMVQTDKGITAIVTSLVGAKDVYFGSTVSNLAAVPLPSIVDSNANISLATDGSRILLIGAYVSVIYFSDDGGLTWGSKKMQEPTASAGFGVTRKALQFFEDKLWTFISTNTGTATLAIYDEPTDSFEKVAVPYYPNTIFKFGENYILGTGNSSTNGIGRIYTSTDKVNWTLRSSPAASVMGFATDGNTIVAATDARGTSINVIRSNDGGITWLTGSSSFDIRSIIYAAGLFVAVGKNGTNAVIQTSTDGNSWAVRRSTTTEAYQKVIYENGLFIAISYGSSFKIFTSPDGITWTGRGLTSYPTAYDIAYVPGINTFFIGTAGNTIYSSTDGINWALQDTLAGPVYGLEYDGVSKVYAITARGSLYTYETVES